MNTTAKKYFGMTLVQLAVLVCLAVTACCLVGGGFLFISSSTASLNASAPTPVDVDATLQTTPEPAPTATITPTPTQTLVPYESLIPQGWSQHKNQSIEIWLPDSFYETEIDVSVRELIKRYRELNQDALADELEESPPGYVFWLETKSPSQKLFTTRLTVYPVLMTEPDLDTFLDQHYNTVRLRHIIVDSRPFEVAYYPARRTLIEANLGGVYAGYVSYAIYDGTLVWFVEGASHFNEFYTWLPIFDDAARTFRFIGQYQ
ncbi:MAG: hypothetical protein Kow002_11600 [Anaerolineales bacterium]